MKSFFTLLEDVSKTYGNSHVLLIMGSSIENASNMPNTASRHMLPLNPAMIRRIFGMRSGKAWHVTGFKHIDNIIKIQRSRKALSTATRINNHTIKYGVEGGGGVMILLKGNIIASSVEDMYTVTDENGRRWVYTGLLFKYIPGSMSLLRKITIDFEKMKTSLYKKYLPIFRDYIEPMKREDYANVGLEYKGQMPETFEDLCVYLHTILPQLKRTPVKSKVSKMVEEYIVGTEKIIAKYADQMHDILFSGFYRKGNSEDYDEWIMDNFEIEKIYVVSPKDITDMDADDLEDWVYLMYRIPPKYRKITEFVESHKLEMVPPFGRLPDGMSPDEVRSLMDTLRYEEEYEDE